MRSGVNVQQKYPCTEGVSAFAIIALLLLLQACMLPIEDLKQIGKEPVFAPVNLPQTTPEYEPVIWPEQFVEPQAEDPSGGRQYANSLWQPGSRDFFKARKARRVGDILRVSVEIDDNAKLENETTRKRSSQEDTQAPSVLGLEGKLKYLLPGSNMNPADLINLTAANSSTGTGTIDRTEEINTEVAAIVTQILPNGNLVIHGDQEMRVNYELRKVTVDGIVRPEDIASDNTISSDLIAQARISYGGRGLISRAQQPRIGSQVLDAVSPF
jgi:flagellar L-ring protein precursor FlgH